MASLRILIAWTLLILLPAFLQCRMVDRPPAAASPVDTAALIGVASEAEELRAAPKETPAGSSQQWRSLWLRQRVDERVMMSSLEVDAAMASIDNEIARATEVRGFLADKRDRAVTRANLLSALFGGGLGATSAGLQLSSRETSATVATGVAGGAISTSLAIYGIRAQRGGTHMLDVESNMLAQFFDRPEMQTSHYPQVVWRFLNEVAPSDPGHLIRRDRLIRTWVELRRVDSLNTASAKLKIEHVTSMPDQHLTLTIDDLEDRIAMLQDVREKFLTSNETSPPYWPRCKSPIQGWKLRKRTMEERIVAWRRVQSVRPT